MRPVFKSAWVTGLLLLIPLAGCSSDRKGARTSPDKDTRTSADRDAANTFLISGSEWLHKKEYDKAIQDFDKAIQLDPKVTLAFSHRGDAWLGK
jgi:Tfp pilus assembly protein PilF